MTERRHDLDALRGFAMLLGIGLHGSMAFFAPFWAVNDRHFDRDSLFRDVFNVIHGFRMPLFFVLSGFFTAMLWQRRGLHAMVRQRLLRVLVPFAISLITLVPLVGWLVGRVADDREGVRTAAPAGSAIEPVDRGPVLDWISSASLHHTWFLWLLLLLVDGFVIVVVLGEKLRLDGVIGSHRRDPLRLAALGALVPATIGAQYLMGDRGAIRVFGPDTSEGIVPVPQVLLYYALFFAWGALLHGARAANGGLLVDRLGRGWQLIVPVALLVWYPLTLAVTGSSDGRGGPWLLAAAMQVVYAWALLIGLMGMSRSVLAVERRGVRYLSDASYWIYLAHLPVVIVGQAIMSDWALPPLAKFLLLCVGVTALLLASYQLLVRYSLIGRLLNGPRRRPERPGQRGASRGASPNRSAFSTR